MYKTFLASSRHLVVGSLKGLILVLWVTFLGFGALLAIQGKASTLLLNSFRSFGKEHGGVKELTPRALLRDFDNRFESAPPISNLLDMAFPEWWKIKIREPDDVTACVEIFERSYAKLRALAMDEHFKIEDGVVETDFLPIIYAPALKTVPVTREIKSWIETERERVKNTASRTSLTDTFVLLIIIGAFGSLIFLIRDYILNRNESTISSYIFRPVLGIFLAISMFVIDIGANAIVSTADILQVRRETLFILALAAGLVADKAYAAIDKRMRVALDKFADDESAIAHNSPEGGGTRKADESGKPPRR